MVRLFETSTTRRTRDLSGTWEFVAASENDDHDYVESFPEDADTLAVPSVWNTTPGQFRHHGIGWFRRTFTIQEATTAKLTFHGVAHESTAYLDGERIASHDCGFTPFEAVVDLEAGVHELVVKADSELHDDSLHYGDYYNYGGITREVVLEELPSVFVDDMAVEYELDGDDVSITTTITIRNEREEAVKRDIDIRIEDTRSSRSAEVGRSDQTEITIGRGIQQETLSLNLTNIECWSPTDPALYTVVATLRDGSSAPDDEYRDRIGFRELTIAGKEIHLNGEPIDLRGVNRHEDHPDWGHAQPRRIQERDLEIIKRAGLNAVRTSHYPNHPRFLDYCDQEGVFVIEEIPNYSRGSNEYGTGDLLERIERVLQDTIDRDRHHPAIVAWSVANECDTSHEDVMNIHEGLVSMAHDADDSRPVTYATDSPLDDITLDVPDFVSINRYPGWYGFDWPPDDLILWEADDWHEYLDRIRDRAPDVPIVISEFGAGGIEGEQTIEEQKWSEPYQATVLEGSIGTFEERDDVAGFTIWQYCDIRTTEDRFHYRPRSKNNKGIVGEYRSPKESYRAVRDLLESEE